MKKSKRICSAIAAFGVLALAGCDLEVPDSAKVVLKSVDYDVSTLPALVADTIVFQDAVLPPLGESTKSDGSAWKTSDGVSLSFYLSGYTKDWSMIFQCPSGDWGSTTAHQCNDKVWVGNAFGCQSGNGTWNQFNGVDCYVTISMDYEAGTMTYYKNGSKVTVYGTGTSDGWAGCEFTISTSEWVKNLINDISESGIYCIHPTDKWANDGAGEYTMKYLVVDAAVDDAGALAKYDAYTSWAAEQ